MADSEIPESTSWIDTLKKGGGQGQKNRNVSAATFAASLSTAVIVFLVEILIFLVLKGKFVEIYAPKTSVNLVDSSEMFTTTPGGLWGWLKPVFRLENYLVISKCGMDAYFFLRYLAMLMKIFFPMAFLILPILLPINKMGGAEDDTAGMDTYGWQNIGPDATHRFWVHLLLACITIVYVCCIFYRELLHYVKIRRKYLTNESYQARASARTVLISNVPRELCDPDVLRALFGGFPGGVSNVWLNHNCGSLTELIERRQMIAQKLEEAELKLIELCIKTKDEENKKQKKRFDKAVKNGETPADAPNEEPEIEIANEGIDNETDKKKKGPVVKFSDRPASIDADDKSIKRDSHGGDDYGPSRPVTPGRTGRFISGAREWGNRVNYAFEQNDRTPRGLQASAFFHKYGYHDPDQHEQTESSEERDQRDLERYGRLPITREQFRPFLRPGPEREEELEKLRKRESDKDGYKYPDSFRTIVDASKTEEEPVWKTIIDPKERETMYAPLLDHPWCPSIPFVGKKVDTIYWCRQYLAELNVRISHDQQRHQLYDKMHSVFVQFNKQIAAHLACQAITHHMPEHMTPRVLGVSPRDIIWDNLSVRWWSRLGRSIFVWGMLVGINFTWAIPITFTGLLSQVSHLTEVFPSLSWIERLPNTAIAFIQGALPPIVLAAILSILPMILRLLCRIEGFPTGMQVELRVQNYYFIFLFVQVFLVASISSGLGVTIEKLVNDPLSVPRTLAENLPKASNYFFSYMVLQALTVSAGALMQFATVFQKFVVGLLMDKTARQKWRRNCNLPQVTWGTFFPVYTNLAAIGLVYSVITPLILVFNAFTFALFWIVYRYQTLYVVRYRIDSGGLFFPRAINQLFTGLYVMELCLIGLFFLARDGQDKAVGTKHAIVMTVMFFLTACYQVALNHSFGPLFHYLPLSDDQEFQGRLETLLGPKRRRTSMTGEEVGLKMDFDPESGEPRGKMTDDLDIEVTRLLKLNTDIGDLELDAFNHSSLRVPKPIIWIPGDKYGVGQDEVRQTTEYSEQILATNYKSVIDKKGKLVYGDRLDGWDYNEAFFFS